MKQFKITFSVLFVFLFFFSLNGYSQNIQIVTPTNAGVSAKEIKNIFGNRINVSAEIIREFYFQQWQTGQEDYNNNCKPPNASLVDTDSGTAYFEWDGSNISPSPTADRFSISYLRLSDGESETFTTNQNSISLFIPNDLFLVVFQTKCGFTKSALDIIIIEKPILLIPNEYSCSCLSSSLIWESETSLIDPNLVSHNWGSINSTKKYYCFVQLSDGLSASFTTTVQFGAEGPEQVSLNPNCLNNVELNQDDTYIYMHEPNLTESGIGVFGFFGSGGVSEVPQFSFNLAADSPYSIDKVYLYSCANVLRSEASNQETIKPQKNVNFRSLLNPVNTYSKVEYDLPQAENISIELFDIYGKQVKVLKNKYLAEAGTHQVSFDMTNLAKGVYFCVLKTQNETLPVKLIKTQ